MSFKIYCAHRALRQLLLFNETNTTDQMVAMAAAIDADAVNMPGNPEVSADMIAEVSVAAAEAGGTLE